MPVATLTSKGQVTIPRAVREALRIGAGDRLDFVALDQGGWAIVPATASIRDLKGILPSRPTPVTLEDMQASIVAGARRE